MLNLGVYSQKKDEVKKKMAWNCLICEKPIKKNDWVVECREFKFVGKTGYIHLSCLKK